MPLPPDTAPTRGPGPDLAARIRRLIRYGAVNVVSLAVDYAVFLPLTAVSGLPVLASVVSYGVAFSLNYVLSRHYVFRGDGAHKSERRLFSEFMATGVLGIALTAAVTGGAIHLVGLGPVAAKTAAVLICFVVLYIVRSRLVFTA